MPSLLTIPVELRELIFDFVLRSERPPPLGVPEERPKNVVHAIDHPLRSFALSAGQYRKALPLRFESAAPTPNSGALSLVNHQISVEVHRLHDLRRFPWTLDILIVHGAEVWPTWTCIPFPTSTVNNVRVSIRILHKESQAPSHDVSCLSMKPPPRIPNMFFAFIAVLEFFLRRGFSAFNDQGAIRSYAGLGERHVTVRSLVLDFKPDGSDLPSLQELRLITKNNAVYGQFVPRNAPRSVLRPELLVVHFHTALERMLLDNSYHLLRQRINTISMCLGRSPSLAEFDLCQVAQFN